MLFFVYFAVNCCGDLRFRQSGSTRVDPTILCTPILICELNYTCNLNIVSPQDYPSVGQYPPVRGMAQSLFFWAHDHPEGGASDESKSKYNEAEAKMAVRLAKHLLLQASYFKSQQGCIKS